MNSEHSSKVNMDSMVQDEASRTKLSRFGLLPSTWRVSTMEQVRILKTGLKIRVQSNLPAVSWPALCNRSNPHSIVLAADFVESNEFSQDEKLATIFHEIGHLVNRPQAAEEAAEGEVGIMDMYLGGLQRLSGENRQLENEEFAADDYVRHLGMKDDLASAIKKIKCRSPSFSDSQMTTQRLNRIERQDDLILNVI